MNQKPRKYSYELKKQVVEAFLAGHAADDIVKKFSLGNQRRVYEWVKKAREGGYETLGDKRGLKSTGKKKKNGQTMEEENERLKLENAYLKKLLDLKRG